MIVRTAGGDWAVKPFQGEREHHIRSQRTGERESVPELRRTGSINPMTHPPAKSSTDHAESLAAALGRVPSGLFVLTLRNGDDETGMLASWVQQCSFDPPQVSVAVNKQRDVLEWLTDCATFALNVIPEGGKALVSHFGKGFERGEPAFKGLEVSRERETPPVLLASHAYLVCRVVNRVDAGDHILVIAHVTAGAVLHEGKPTVHVRKNGLRY
jgi:flavin reductase (DIM6/NTAB) family NADH-FMN oxidoreductase RutF